MPSVLIAGAWIGIWFVWPQESGERRQARPRRSRTALVQLPRGQERLHVDPTLFGRRSRIGFTIAERKDLVPETTPYKRNGTAALLPRELGVSSPTAVPDAGGGATEGAYRPAWECEEMFPPAGGDAALLQVQPRGELKRLDLQVPDLPARILEHTDQPWSLVLFVEADRAGSVEHVFVEKGSGIGEIDDAVVRAMYRGRLDSTGTACSGRVDIGFGAGSGRVRN